jgi:hypothetical protein
LIIVTIVDTGGKFATGVNDTGGGKFATGVNDTGDIVPLPKRIMFSELFIML